MEKLCSIDESSQKKVSFSKSRESGDFVQIFTYIYIKDESSQKKLIFLEIVKVEDFMEIYIYIYI